MAIYTKEQLIQISVQSGCIESQDSAEDFANDNGIFYLPHPKTKKCTKYRIEYNAQSQLPAHMMAPAPSSGGSDIGTAYAREESYILQDPNFDFGSSNHLVYAVPHIPFELNGRHYYAYDPSGRYLKPGAGFVVDSYKYDQEKSLWYKEFPTVSDFDAAVEWAASNAAQTTAKEEAAEAALAEAEAAAQAELNAAIEAAYAYAITPDYRPILTTIPNAGNKPNLFNADTFVDGNFEWPVNIALQVGEKTPVLHNELVVQKQTTDPFRAVTGFLWKDPINAPIQWVRDLETRYYNTDFQPGNLGSGVSTNMTLEL